MNILSNGILGFWPKVILLATLITIIFGGTSSALSGSEFKAGRIIDDTHFYNGTTMSATEIQNFLNAKLPSCDTNGAQNTSYYFTPSTGEVNNDNEKWDGDTWVTTTRATYGQRVDNWKRSQGKSSVGSVAPYTCLKNYRQNTGYKAGQSGLCSAIDAKTDRTAAQIIDDIARACHISQKVILVMLQKEQGLVTDDWPWGIQYRGSMGYGCPDTAPCDAEYYGFFNQVYNAALQFQRYKADPSYWNHVPFMTNQILYQANAPSCGSRSTYIENYATAGLYNYTPYTPNAAALNNLYGNGDNCSAYGNRNFWRYYNDWFGSPTNSMPVDCDSKVAEIVCAWSVRKSDGSQFLTTSRTELLNAINTYGWTSEGIAFYASKTARPGTIAIHRLRNENLHYYTVEQSEYTSLKNTSGWVDEGVPFYVYPHTNSVSVSHKVYKLYNSTLNQFYWTKDTGMRDRLIDTGYTLQSTPFSTFSGLVDAPLPASGRANIYRLKEGEGYFYTASLAELDSVIKLGYTYEGLLTSANDANSGTPVYRLQSGGKHLYTTSASERDGAVANYGFVYEGIGFYVDNLSDNIYRLTNTRNNIYLFTSNLGEVASIVNTDGWIYEGTLLNNVTDITPVYRLLNKSSGRHFYTTNLSEAMRIVNKGWNYETVSFYANRNSGSPVYRLLSRDKHLYTASTAERDSAVSKYGYVYEGIAFYANSATTGTPTYRLQGGNDEYFYTISTAERDSAVSKYGYVYEGLGFYLPTGN